MSTSPDTVAYLLEQLEPLNARARAMFGEYGVYVDEKMIILVCDDTAFIKPTPGTAGYEQAPPYPGAKPHAVIPAEVLEDADALRALAQATADVTPAPRPKKPKATPPTS